MGGKTSAPPAEGKAAPRVWEQEFLDELVEYVGFTPEHARVLAEIAPYVTPHFPKIVDRFYEAITDNPRARVVFTGGAPQIERQKHFLSDWLRGVVSGVYDVEYLKLRARIGRTHVRIRLDQRYMFSAMNIVREGLHEALDHSDYDPLRRSFAHRAIDKICDLELAIMLQTYSEDYLERMRDNERLATLGQLAGFIGHELRNPLAVMETSLHLLKKRLPVKDESTARHMRRLGEQVAISSGIISDLLELARDRPVERTPVRLASMFDTVRESLLVPLEGIELEMLVEPGLELARFDEKQVQRMLVNLINNACEAVASSSPPRRVVVRAQRDGEQLVLTVDDTGPGIAEEVRHRLFEPLATTRVKGLGLGLALCRRIVEKHGGDIRAHNRPEGGARFEVRLPQAFEE